MEKLSENQESGEQIKNWEALYAKVESGGVTTSSGVGYTTENLNEAIDVARATEFGNLNLFTRNEGLRSQAACLFIEEVDTFEELYKLLPHIDSISGSGGESYTGEELLSKVQSLEAVIFAQDDTWQQMVQTFTRAYGLRDAITRCLENNK